MEHLPGFASLADRFDGFILDLWGVIHDGVNAFPHAVDCLTRLREAGKRTLLLSNVPRPNDAAQALMRGMGIPDDLYTDILTSGEAVRRALQRPPDLWWAELGQRVFHLGPERDRGVIEGLALTKVAQPAEANFVLNTGPDDHRNPTDMAEFEAVLADCARHHLPMICANDLGVFRGKVTLVVNVASECGYTPQYEGLERLHRELSEKGFSVLGFPSNDFGGQEPGTAQEIAAFCKKNYGVTFPMFSKLVTVRGPNQSPIYQLLGASGHLPAWNFSKYVVDKSGQVVAFFPSAVEPDAPELRDAITKALQQR